MIVLVDTMAYHKIVIQTIMKKIPLTKIKIIKITKIKKRKIIKKMYKFL